MMTDSTALLADVAAVTGIDCAGYEWRSVTGGDINQAWVLTSSSGPSYFLKLNDTTFADIFAAEFDGLHELLQSNTVYVPEPFGYGATEKKAWLLMESLELRLGNNDSAAQLGQQLAAMHRRTVPQFGWYRDNAIGSTPQSNAEHDNWTDFWREERLQPQLERAGMIDIGAPLLGRLEDILAGYTPAASLLHGDLWGGNWAALADGTPVIFDPAVYYGDREADIAMTTLFGGFSDSFYDAYNASWPLEEGYEKRRNLYNLYHVLNHCNLFGGSYRPQAEAIISDLLKNA